MECECALPLRGRTIPAAGGPVLCLGVGGEDQISYARDGGVRKDRAERLIVIDI
ncbi:MAG: hypothetical protein ABIS07_07355 [Dokdonella sp.]